jgi:hypothetical protein
MLSSLRPPLPAASTRRRSPASCSPVQSFAPEPHFEPLRHEGFRQVSPLHRDLPEPVGRRAFAPSSRLHGSRSTPDLRRAWRRPTGDQARQARTDGQQVASVVYQRSTSAKKPATDGKSSLKYFLPVCSSSLAQKLQSRPPLSVRSSTENRGVASSILALAISSVFQAPPPGRRPERALQPLRELWERAWVPGFV